MAKNTHRLCAIRKIQFSGGNRYFIIFWPEFALMSNTTAAKTIEVLKGYFATWGLPNELVSDNGPQFVSSEFQTSHNKSPAYHPASNGAAERSVQNLKKALEKGKNDSMSLMHCFHNSLFCYRSTPQSTRVKLQQSCL